MSKKSVPGMGYISRGVTLLRDNSRNNSGRDVGANRTYHEDVCGSKVRTGQVVPTGCLELLLQECEVFLDVAEDHH